MRSNGLLRNIKLNFQNLAVMLLNDLKLFIRDRKSLILVLLTPFLILSVLVNLYDFSDVSENIRGVKLAVCDLDNSGFSLETEIFDVTVFTKDCDAEVYSKVSRGEFRGAIVIPKGFTQDIKDGRGVELKLYIDNSKSTTAVVTANAVTAYVDDLNQKIGTEFILEAWEQLRLLNDNLRFLVDKLEKAQPVAEAISVGIKGVNSQIGEIDFNSHRETVASISAFLDVLESQMAIINDSLAPASGGISSLPLLNFTPGASIVISEYNTQSAWMKDNLCAGIVSDILPDPICDIFNVTDKLVASTVSDAAVINAFSDEVNSQIAQLNANISAVNSAFDGLSSFIVSSSATNQKIRADIDALQLSLAVYQEKTENLSRSLDELETSIDTYTSDMAKVTSELKSTIVVLDEYTKKDPASILRPVNVKSSGVFKAVKEIVYRLPALLSIILMFITLLIASSLIVNERKGGTMARIFLSPLSMFFYIFEKMIYLLLLCAASIVAMLIAGLIFGAPLHISFPVVVVLLVASSLYISIGVFIGSVSKSENTALLTCLVVSFPLMFMCGVFSPPELMDKFIRVVAAYLPLTLNINLLESITLYKAGFDMFSLFLMLAMLLVFYLAAVFIIRKKPTLK
jgi:ABC-type multidrug transport system permease subunit